MNHFTITAIAITVSLGLWFWTQRLISAQQESPQIVDKLHLLSARLHTWLTQHQRPTNLLLIASSACIDAIGIFLLCSALFGNTIRPFLSLLAIFILRQVCQLTTSLPPPSGMIWRKPGFPSLLVTYGVSNDLFFSGHTAIAVLGAVELALLHNPIWLIVGISIAIFEMVAVVILRAHYTIDVFTGAVVAGLICMLSYQASPIVDQWLSHLIT